MADLELDNEHPWEQIQGVENNLWYSRFDIFLKMGPVRSVNGAHRIECQRLGKPKPSQWTPRSWREASLNFHWRERAEAYDEYRRREVFTDGYAYELNRIRKLNDLLDRLEKRVNEALANMKPTKGGFPDFMIGRYLEAMKAIAEETGGRIQRDAAPADLKRVVRSWDLAATEEKDDEKKSGPDFTAGLKVARMSNGQYIILDARRMRETPRKVDEAVKNTAEQDGRRVSVFMEQEPGSSGVRTISDFSILLAGFDFHGIRSTGSKVERARGASSQAENGNVFILRAPWNEDFLNELEAFPNERVHDDWVDAFSLAMGQLYEMGADDYLAELEQRLAAREQRAKPKYEQKIAAAHQ